MAGASGGGGGATLLLVTARAENASERAFVRPARPYNTHTRTRFAMRNAQGAFRTAPGRGEPLRRCIDSGSRMLVSQVKPMKPRGHSQKFSVRAEAV